MLSLFSSLIWKLPLAESYKAILSPLSTLRRVEGERDGHLHTKMGSIDVLNMDGLDQILKEQVNGENPALPNACFCVMGKEGTYNARNITK